LPEYCVTPRHSEAALRRVFEMAARGQLPIRAHVISESGEPASLGMQQVTITRDGKKTVLIGDPVILSTNSIEGDKTQRSAVSISFPLDDSAVGTIQTIGNASISTSVPPADIAMIGGVTEMRETGNGALILAGRDQVLRLGGRDEP